MKSFLLALIVGILINENRLAQCADVGSQMFSSECEALKKRWIVDIEPAEQELLAQKAEIDCDNKLESYWLNATANANACYPMWDTVLCWPETSLNTTIQISCPNYILRFNMKNYAYKTCLLDSNTSEPVWSLTNYDKCFEEIICSETTCSIENHIDYIVMMRIVGYVASMLTLVLSIAILLRSRLRCPRNFVHINLFLAFSFRTILTMLVDINPEINSNQSLENKELTQFKFCKILITLFFYSGSVFTVAITAEALYLVMLLKNPFYSEKRGAIICIALSWVLPIVWMVPWVAFTLSYNDVWCWHTESPWKLIIKIPHSLLLITNICFAISIIRILYLKTVSTNGIRSHENYASYRKFAKSILILIPVFGLHFIFFAWLPYAQFFNIKVSACFEIVIFYIETFFNAFQGLAVAVMCCLKYREVRTEMVLIACSLMKNTACLKTCFHSDYTSRLRFKSVTITLTPSSRGSKASNNSKPFKEANRETVNMLDLENTTKYKPVNDKSMLNNFNE